jgi:hypothetical protein
MKTWVRKALAVGVLTAGAILFAPGGAQADTTQISAGNNGVLNGNQIYVPIQIPVNVCGNGIGALIGIGVGVGFCSNGAAQDIGKDGHHDDDYDNWDNYDNGGSADDARLTPRALDAPKPHKQVRTGATESVAVDRTEDTFQGSFDNDGVLNGNQIYVPVQVPINICGNGIGALIGLGVGIGFCSNGAAQDADFGHGHHGNGDRAAQGVESASPRVEDTFQGSFDNDGVLNGNQIYIPVQVPINICGNGIAILGIAAGVGFCSNGALQDVESTAPRVEDTTQISAGNDGVLNGNQIYVPVQVPINVCGNGIGAIVGIGLGVGFCSNGAVQDADFGNDHHGNGDNGNGDRVAKRDAKAGHSDGYDYDAKTQPAKGDYGRDWKTQNSKGGHKKSLTSTASTKMATEKATEAGLPLLGDLTSALPLPLLGGAMSPLGALGKAGTPDLPALGALRTSKVNVAGVDPVDLLGQQAAG